MNLSWPFSLLANSLVQLTQDFCPWTIDRDKSKLHRTWFFLFSIYFLMSFFFYSYKIKESQLPKVLSFFSSVQSLSRVRLFATPWTAARQASLSITNSWSSLRLTSIESVMPSSHLILFRPLLLLPPIFPSIRVFSNQLFTSGGQSTGVSASTSVFPMNTQDRSPLGWTGCICNASIILQL